MDGQGTYVWKNGDRYAGIFQRGVKEGKGVLTWINGDRWVGVFHADEQTDDGEQVSAKP
jgi:hypothetical protein